MTRGVFVAIDGPGGAGKSTLTSALAAVLQEDSRAVYQTRQPTDTPLGKMARYGTDRFKGRAMAHLIAADRYHHLDELLLPALRRGEIVVCDRYIASSLVLQVMDGLDLETVWQINSAARLPDLAVFVTGHPDVIADRLAARGAHSRYERMPNSSHIEHRLFTEAASFFVDQGVQILELDATATDPESLARIVAGEVIALMQNRPTDDPGRAHLQPEQPRPAEGRETVRFPYLTAGAGPGPHGDSA